MQELDRETVRLLAGSQTISSVKTVVKELVENSLDAGATNIEVKLDNYGLDKVEVCDNGSGISTSDTLNIARPHYTSKITSFNDLCDLQSYGFRGEALSSIASIAHLQVSTLCSNDEDAGRRYDFDHMGNSVSFRHVAMGQGTSVCVTGLFKNVPVRRQFLMSAKRCREDLKNIEDTMLAFGIAHPRLRFVLKHNKCLLWQKIPNNDYDSNLSLVLGSSITQHLTPISFSSRDPFLKLHGHVPRPGDDGAVSRSTPDRLFVFVNNRPVVIKQVTQILKQSFADVFPSKSGRAPVAVLHLEVPPSSLDVNLDPSKTSVLLTEQDFVCSTLTSVLSQLYSPHEVTVENGSKSSSNHPDETRSHCQQGTEADVSAYPLSRTRMNPYCAPFLSSELCEPLSNAGLEHETSHEVISLEEETSGAGSLEQEASAACPSVMGPVQTGRDYQINKTEVNSTKTTDNPKEENVRTKKVTLLQWSRGEMVRDACNQPVQPVQLLQPQHDREQSGHIPKEKLATNKFSLPVKRKLAPTPSPTIPKKRNTEGTTTKQPPLFFETLPQTDALSFDLQSIQRRITLKRRGKCDGDRRGKVVGYCSPPGVWLVVSDNSISCFLTARLLEVAEVPSMSQVQSLLDHTLSTATDLTSHLYCIHEL